MNEPQEHVVDAEKRRLFDWNELWHYKELFYFFTWRDIKIKYKQTVLGFLWAILQPLLMMIIFSALFARALKIDDLPIPYPVFAFSGLLLWNTFSTGLTNSANSMVTNAQIIKKIYFPRLIIPVSSILVSFFDFLMAFILFIPLLVYYQLPVATTAFWCWPVALIICVVATLGPGCLLAALNVKYRDFRYVIPFLVQFLFFLCPVIYPISMAAANPILKYIIVASPMYVAIELFRFPITSTFPDTTLMLISMGSGIFFLLAGLIYFKRTEDFFADFA